MDSGPATRGRADDQDGATMRRVRWVCAVAGATLAVLAAQAVASEPATVERAYPTPKIGKTRGSALGAEYAYGATWVDVGGRAVVRIGSDGPGAPVRVRGRLLGTTTAKGRVWALSSGSAKSWITEISRSGKRVRTFVIPGSATAMVPGFGRLWVSTRGRGFARTSLLAIDMRTGARRHVRTFPGEVLTGPVAGAGAVWWGPDVDADGGVTIIRIDPKTLRRTKQTFVGGDDGSPVSFLTRGNDLWWYAGGSTVSEITGGLLPVNLLQNVPETAAITLANQTIYLWPATFGGGVAAYPLSGGSSTLQFPETPEGGYVSGLSVGGGSTWLVWSAPSPTATTTSLTRTTPSLADPVSVDLTRYLRGATQEPSVTYGGGSIWVATGGPSVLEIDPDTVG
jgi:hypothetical protein